MKQEQQQSRKSSRKSSSKEAKAGAEEQKQQQKQQQVKAAAKATQKAGKAAKTAQTPANAAQTPAKAATAAAQTWKNSSRSNIIRRKSSSKETRRRGGPNREKVRALNGGAPTGGAPKGGSPKFRAFFFFSFSRLKFHSLCSLCASSRGMSVVLEVLGPSKMHVWSSLGRHVLAQSGCAAGVSHTLKRRLCSGLQKHQVKFLGGRREKERNFGRSSGGRSCRGRVHCPSHPKKLIFPETVKKKKNCFWATRQNQKKKKNSFWESEIRSKKWRTNFTPMQKMKMDRKNEKLF